MPFGIAADKYRRIYLRRREILCRNRAIEPQTKSLIYEDKQRKAIVK